MTVAAAGVRVCACEQRHCRRRASRFTIKSEGALELADIAHAAGARQCLLDLLQRTQGCARCGGRRDDHGHLVARDGSAATCLRRRARTTGVTVAQRQCGGGKAATRTRWARRHRAFSKTTALASRRACGNGRDRSPSPESGVQGVRVSVRALGFICSLRRHVRGPWSGPGPPAARARTGARQSTTQRMATQDQLVLTLSASPAAGKVAIEMVLAPALRAHPDSATSAMTVPPAVAINAPTRLGAMPPGRWTPAGRWEPLGSRARARRSPGPRQGGP